MEGCKDEARIEFHFGQSVVGYRLLDHEGVELQLSGSSGQSSIITDLV